MGWAAATRTDSAFRFGTLLRSGLLRPAPVLGLGCIFTDVSALHRILSSRGMDLAIVVPSPGPPFHNSFVVQRSHEKYIYGFEIHTAEIWQDVISPPGPVPKLFLGCSHVVLFLFGVRTLCPLPRMQPKSRQQATREPHGHHALLASFAEPSEQIDDRSFPPRFVAALFQ